MRPNLHIADYCATVQLFLDAPESQNIQSNLQCWLSKYVDPRHRAVGETGRRSKNFRGNGDIPIMTTPSDDNRSYHINSDKIRRILGFTPTHSIEEAVRDLCHAFKQGKLANAMTDDVYYNVRRMKNFRAA